MTTPQQATAATAPPPTKGYTTAADAAATIRAALKREHGWSSRDVSVRAENYSLGSSISVTVKRPGIRLALVEGIAEAEERISRCEITGEILNGGNRYVRVRLDYELTRPAATRLRAHLATVEPGASFTLPGFRVQKAEAREHFAYVWPLDEGAAAVVPRGELDSLVSVDGGALADMLAGWLIQLDRACTCGAVQDAPDAHLASHLDSCGRAAAAAVAAIAAESDDEMARRRAAVTVAACLDEGDVPGALYVLEQLEPIAAAAVAVEAFGATSRPAQFRQLLANAAGATTTNGRSTR